MITIPPVELEQFITAFEQGEVIGYPTEAVFGLGCDPDIADAVNNVLAIKTRPQDKGLILIAATFEQLLPYIDISELEPEIINKVHATWPGPYTWIMPKAKTTPDYLTGGRNTIAVRVSAHPTVIIVIGDKIFHCIVWKESFHFSIKLSSKSFIWSKN